MASEPTRSEVDAFHHNSDVDVSPRSQHHTIGQRSNQASPGDHNHDGENSPLIPWSSIDPSTIPDPVPYRFSQGVVTISGFTAGTSLGVAITFPVGRFTQPPRINTEGKTSNPGVVNTSSGFSTTGGVTLYGFRSDSVATLSVEWSATQMTSANTDG